MITVIWAHTLDKYYSYTNSIGVFFDSNITLFSVGYNRLLIQYKYDVIFLTIAGL